MGISGSDEFCEVKDMFFEYFYKGMPIAKIEKAIIDHYKAAYNSDENDGIWHNVYFALAESEWKCGALKKPLFKTVKKIIKKKQNLNYFYHELGCTDSDLKKREKVLEQFLLKLESKNDKPLKQTVKAPYVTPFKTGDVFVYKTGNKFNSGIVLYVRAHSGGESKWCFNYLIAIADLESETVPTIEQIANSEIYYASWHSANGLIPKNRIRIIDNIYDAISKDYNFRECLPKYR